MTDSWAFQDAKAKLSEVIRASEQEPQRITVRGEEKAYVVSAKDFRRMRDASRQKSKKGATSLYEALRACPYELKIPPRSRERGRDVKL
jgi:prevent-host-death family protein